MDIINKHNNVFWLNVLPFLLLMVTICQNAACQDDLDKLQTEIHQLQQIIQLEIKSKNHPVVEQTMDRLLLEMDKEEKTVKDKSKQMQMRIQYSMNAKRFFAAYDAASSWLELHPKDIPVTNLLGITCIYMNRNREAREALRTVYQSEPDNESYQERYLNILKVLNERADCFALCQTVLSNPNRSSKLKALAINALIDMDMETEALSAVESLETMEGKSSLLAFIQAKMRFKESEFENALLHFQKVKSTHPRYAQAQSQIALCFAQLRRFNEAARQNLQILGRNPYDQNAFIHLAQALSRLKKLDAAKLVVSIQKQIEQNEMPIKEGDYYWSKGDMLEFGRLQAIGMNLKHQFRQAEQLLAAISESVPESTQAKINLGKHYFTTLQASKAEKVFRQLLNLQDDKNNITLLLVEALLRQDKPDEVLKMRDRLEVENNESYNALLGSYYLEIKMQPDKALQHLNTIHDVTYSITAAKAKCFAQLHQPNEALNLLSKIPDTEITPEQILIKADCMIQLGNIEEAEQWIEQTRKDNPRLSPFLIVPVQAALMTAKNDPSQIEWEKKAKEIKRIQQVIQSKVTEAQRTGLPGSVSIFVELSDKFEEMGDRQNALLYIRRAYDAEPNNPNHLISLIQLMTAEENVIERYHLIQKAKQMDAIHDEMKDELKEVYMIIGLN